MIQILTDSSTDFEPCELKEKNILCVPLRVIFDDREYKENIDISKDEFYKTLKNSPSLPKTSQPSPEDFLKIFEKAKSDNDEIVGIFLSSKLSGTYQCAQLAKNMADFENAHIIDGLSATGGTRILVEYALNLRNSGFGGKEISEKIEQIKHKITIVASLDTPENLKKGGRISETAAALGTAVHIKPIIKIAGNGKIALPSKVIGLKRTIRYIIRQLMFCGMNTDFPIYVLYADDKSNAVMLANALKEADVDISPKNIFNIGAVIGTHTGPGAFGIAFVSK